MSSSSLAPAAGKKKESSPSADTLEARCLSVIAANIERYPPEAFAIISEDSWDSIVQERNEKTRPSTGTGGLDGSGRLLPAVSAPFLLKVERLNPHLADSAVADRLAWKDCVEYSFHSGSISRPPALQYPWPLLVRKLTRSGEILMELLSDDEQSDACRNQELFQRHVHALSESPMNVSLLQASGIGKAVQKFVKACEKEKPETLNVDTELPVRGREPAGVKAAVSPLAMLKETLQRWKRMAANSGVQTSSNDAQGDQKDANINDQEDLRLAESCQSWRELYMVVKQREEKRRAKQGERMREIRQNLATGRPKVIKVRAAKSRHDSILDRADKKGGARFGSSSAPPFAAAGGNAKMRALKKESRIATTLQKSSARPEQKKKASFGAAVAFATNSKPTKSTKRRAGQQVVTMAGGKRMKIPTTKASSQRRPPFPSRR